MREDDMFKSFNFKEEENDVKRSKKSKIKNAKKRRQVRAT